MDSYVWDVPMLMSHQYIDDHLEGKAESCPRPKPVLPGHDFVKLLHFHYREDDSEYPDGQQYAQQAALMIFDFLTGQKLYHRHFEFLIDRNDDGSQCFGVRPLFTRFKNETRCKQRKKLTWYEEGDVLTCPVAHLMALAIHDRAFKLDELNDVNNLLSTKLPPDAERVVLRWKDDFRTSSPGFPDKELTASTALKRLQRLGINIGFQERLTWYCLRRQLLNAVAGVVCEDDLIKIAGHRRRETYETHHANHNINLDTQSIVKGRTPNNSRIARLSYMSAGADPRANTTLTAEDHDHIKSQPDVQELRITIKEGADCIESLDADQSSRKQELLALMKDCRRRLRARKQFYRSRLLASLRAAHFEGKDERLLLNKTPLCADAINDAVLGTVPDQSNESSCNTFMSTERSLLASLDPGEDIRVPAHLNRGIQAMQAMVDLCSRVGFRSSQQIVRM